MTFSTETAGSSGFGLSGDEATEPLLQHAFSNAESAGLPRVWSVGNRPSPQQQRGRPGTQGPCLAVYCSAACVERLRPLKQSLEGLGATVHINSQVEFLGGSCLGDCTGPTGPWSPSSSASSYYDQRGAPRRLERGWLTPEGGKNRSPGASPDRFSATGSSAASVAGSVAATAAASAQPSVPFSASSGGGGNADTPSVVMAQTGTGTGSVDEADAASQGAAAPQGVAELPACDAVLVLWSQYFHAALQHRLIELSERAGSKGALLLNDVRRLFDMQDRRWLMRKLRERGIPTPMSVECSRDRDESPSVEEHHDYILVQGQRINKPFFEKPVDRRDRAIYLYFPKDAGGGRAVICSHESGDVDCFSRFDSTSRVRREGSYVYQEYTQSDGLVVQAVCIGGQAYGNAVHSGFIGMAASTVPCVTPGGPNSVAGGGAGCTLGSTVAMTGGCPVFLRQEEKLIAKNLSMVMHQTLFGITFARTHSGERGRVRSLVLDVWPGIPRGGFGLFCEDVARALLAAMHRRLPTRGFPTRSRSVPQISDDGSPDRKMWASATLTPSNRYHRERRRSGDVDELSEVAAMPSEARSVVADAEEDLLCLLLLCRHGDRTPKQKAKAKIRMPSEYAAGWLSGWLAGADALVKEATQGPQSFDLRTPDQLMRLHDAARQLQAAGHNLGTLADALASFDQLGTLGEACHAKLGHDGQVINVAIKWGGELTATGIQTSEDFGAVFRHKMCDDIDVGSVRHDMKVYSSREPRCLQTAAAFLKGFLRLNITALPPIIAALVRREESGLLDAGNGGKNYTGKGGKDTANSPPYSLDATWAEIQALASPWTRSRFVSAVASPALAPFGGPRPALRALAAHTEAFLAAINTDDTEVDPLHNAETTALLVERYRDTLKDIQLGESPWSFEKVPKLGDHILYDFTHNSDALPEEAQRALEAAFELCFALCDAQAALEVAMRSSLDSPMRDDSGLPLLQKMRWDLRVASGADLGEEKAHVYKHDYLYGSGGGAEKPCVRTRLYFCHNSHVQGVAIALARQQCAQVLEEDSSQPWDVVAGRLGYLAHMALRLRRRRRTGELRVSCHLGRGERDDEHVQLFDLPLAEVDACFTQELNKAKDDPQSR